MTVAGGMWCPVPLGGVAPQVPRCTLPGVPTSRRKPKQHGQPAPPQGARNTLHLGGPLSSGPGLWMAEAPQGPTASLPG